MELEGLVPLFRIFLQSPCPEGEASIWLNQQQHQPNHHLITSAFLSQLLSPIPNSPPTLHRCLWMQTLPSTLQSRIFSFLAIENHRFCRHSLLSLATRILDSIAEDGGAADERFWVATAARHLLDELSARGSGAAGAAQEGGIEVEKGRIEEVWEDFDSLPQWLEDAAARTRSAFAWLPLSPGQLTQINTRTLEVVDDDLNVGYSSPMDVQDEVLEGFGNLQVEIRHDECCNVLSPQILERAKALKDDVTLMVSPSNALQVCRNVSQLFREVGEGSGWKNCLLILEILQPWEAEDETALLLLSHLSGECEVAFPDHPGFLFAAVILPKLLNLKRSVSRALLSSCVDFCKKHPKLVTSSLLFPLIYTREGINVPIRDVLSRVINELHLSYVSAFCHRLLCMERVEGDFSCLSCHSKMLSNKLVWTESMFSLFQHILSLDVTLTPDSIDKLIYVLESVADNFAKSLKVGNFLLCLVTKTTHAVEFHRNTLLDIARKTDTFVTKTIVSKLEGPLS